MAAKPLKQSAFTKDGVKHYARIQRTGDKIPQPARIVVLKEFWEDVGGSKGWETVSVYDKTFADWYYAYAVYDEILRRREALWSANLIQHIEYRNTWGDSHAEKS